MIRGNFSRSQGVVSFPLRRKIDRLIFPFALLDVFSLFGGCSIDSIPLFNRPASVDNFGHIFEFIGYFLLQK